MRTILWFIQFWASLFALMPSLRKAEKLQQAGDTAAQDDLTRKSVRRWADMRLRTAGVQVTVIGKENLPDSPAVYVGNHLGNFDIPLLLTHLGEFPPAIVAKKELAKLPLVSRWMRLLHCEFLDRKDARAAMTTLQAATAHVKNGYPVVIFPEGTRSRTGLVGEFKSGAFRIAQKSGAALVPLCIRGTDRVMERNGNWIRPAKVELHILPAIDTTNFTREQWRDLPQQMEELIRAAVNARPDPNGAL